MRFDGLLYFPITPFDRSGRVAVSALREHLQSRLPYRPGAVFPACGTGEFHALSVDEIATVVATTVDAVDGTVPVVSGAGGPLGHAIACASSAKTAGATAVLLLPPYLVSVTQRGLVDYVEAVTSSTDMPVILYHRGVASYTAETVTALLGNPRVIGFKDGIGDIGLAQQVSSAVRQHVRDDIHLFNGLLTAELSQGAYRGIGIPLYSSAAFAMAPRVAVAYYESYRSGDEETRTRLLEEFYEPLVELRDEVPGFGVALIKAGVARSGLDVGGVRPPLVDPDPDQLTRLGAIIDRGDAIVDELDRQHALANDLVG